MQTFSEAMLLTGSGLAHAMSESPVLVALALLISVAIWRVKGDAPE